MLYSSIVIYFYVVFFFYPQEFTEIFDVWLQWRKEKHDRLEKLTVISLCRVTSQNLSQAHGIERTQWISKLWVRNWIPAQVETPELIQ